jgi:initiation factor 1A
MKSSKNAMSKNYRAAGNQRTVSLALSGDMDGIIYAKVLTRLGDARMRIYYEEDNKGHEGIGRIRGLLRKRGQVPIGTNDIVIVSGRDFESGKNNFDIIAVLSPKDAADLKKRKEIPDYFLNNAESSEFSNKEKEEAFDFDYDDDKEIDIDKI